MLQFFRKYQKYFFIVITISVVISFVFFGTYGVLTPGVKKEKDVVAFVSIGGKKIWHSYLEQMTQFLSVEDWMLLKGPFDSNFLNDGVISKEFIDTGMAAVLAKSFGEYFKDELTSRLAEEKRFTPYVHPYLPGITAAHIWSIFAPNMVQKLAELKKAEDPLSKEAFQTRLDLLLAERSFPPAFLGQVLRYQEKERTKGLFDTRLMREDPSLFGYRNLSDWFGPHFMEGVAKTIINVAALARKQGFKVSKEELISELMVRCEKTFDALKEQGKLPISSGYELLQVYLKQRGMEEKTLVAIWEDITLFRRLFHGIGGAVQADVLPLECFYGYAKETASIDLFQMAPELRFQNEQDLIKFETYVAAVGEEPEKETGIPLEISSLDVIESRAPELIGKHYVLSVAEAKWDALLAKVEMKATWEWESDPLNWDILKKQFPELGVKEGTSFEILEQMDPKGRKLVDAFARKQIVLAHPEWIEEALDEAPWREQELFLTPASKKAFAGIQDIASFIQLLEEKKDFSSYSQDQQHFYRIGVQKVSDKQVAAFKYALQEGLLDQLTTRLNGKELALKFIESVDPAAAGDQARLDAAAQYRLSAFLSHYREKKPEGFLGQQWVIEKKQKDLVRAHPIFISIDNAFDMEPGTFSNIAYDPKEGLYCYRYLGQLTDSTVPADKMLEAQKLLSRETRCHFFEEILPGLALYLK